MTPPSPFTRIVQMLSALLGGVWAKLFLSRNETAALQEVMAGLKAFDALFARWKAGTLVIPPPTATNAPAPRESAVRAPRFPATLSMTFEPTLPAVSLARSLSIVIRAPLPMLLRLIVFTLPSEEIVPPAFRSMPEAANVPTAPVPFPARCMITFLTVVPATFPPRLVIEN